MTLKVCYHPQPSFVESNPDNNRPCALPTATYDSRTETIWRGGNELRATEQPKHADVAIVTCFRSVRVSRIYI